MRARGSVLIEIVGAFVLIGGLFMSGLLMGRHLERGEWVQKQNAAIVQAGLEYDDRLRKANTAAAAAIDEARRARDFATALQQEISHVPVPLVVTSVRPLRCALDRAAGPAGLVRAVAAERAAASSIGAADQPAPAPVDATQGLDAGGSVWLTLSAVRLWNSALAGEQLPAGACRADDPASAACAARSGTTLEDAFGDHTENAARCRQDRSQLNRLIDALEARQARTAPEPTP